MTSSQTVWELIANALLTRLDKLPQSELQQLCCELDEIRGCDAETVKNVYLNFLLPNLEPRKLQHRVCNAWLFGIDEQEAALRLLSDQKLLVRALVFMVLRGNDLRREENSEIIAPQIIAKLNSDTLESEWGLKPGATTQKILERIHDWKYLAELILEQADDDPDFVGSGSEDQQSWDFYKQSACEWIFCHNPQEARAFFIQVFQRVDARPHKHTHTILELILSKPSP